MQQQVQNTEQIELLKGTFQPRYENNFAWGNAVAMLRFLPHLRSLYPFATVSSANVVNDFSGLAQNMNPTGVPVVSWATLAPYATFNGATAYTTADTAENSITGLEAHVSAGQRGLALGCWVNMGSVAANQAIFTKWLQGTNNRSYRLWINAAGAYEWAVSVDGIAGVVIASTVAPVLNTWTFLAANFLPSTSLNIWVNKTKTTNVAAIPASVFNSTALLAISGQNAGLNLMTGNVALPFLCASRLSDTHIFAIYEQTRALFGV